MKALIAVVALLATTAPAIASAQDWGHRGGAGYERTYGADRDGRRYEGRRYEGRGDDGRRGDWRGGDRNWRDEGRGDDWRGRSDGWRGDRNWSGQRYGDGRWSHRGAGWNRRGGYLPPYYRGYVVRDYSRYHLRRPPPGYYWYRTGDDYVMAAIASGLIFDIIAGDQGRY